MHRVAAVQMASGPNVTANLLEAERLIKSAAKDGAKLVVLPENFAILGDDQLKLDAAESLGDGPIQTFLQGIAKKYDIWLVGGTIPLKSDDGESNKVYSSTLVYNGDGQQIHRYDKVHLFDVELSETAEVYCESKTTIAGSRIEVIDSPFGRIGIAVCYDLRFPELFRKMFKQNVDILVLPAAFTATTGKAHWEVLVRARAIENLSYVIAAAQGGFHNKGRETYGHSMIVDPWGTVVASLPKGAGVVAAEVDLEKQQAIRKNIPVREHAKLL